MGWVSKGSDCGGRFGDSGGFDESEELEDLGGLGDHTGDGTQAMDAEMLESLQIRLNSGSSTTVGSGDGQGDKRC